MYNNSLWRNKYNNQLLLLKLTVCDNPSNWITLIIKLNVHVLALRVKQSGGSKQIPKSIQEVRHT